MIDLCPNCGAVVLDTVWLTPWLNYINNKKLSPPCYLIRVPFVVARKIYGRNITFCCTCVNTVISSLNNYPECESWLLIPPVVRNGRQTFTHQVWMKRMLMCSIRGLNHGLAVKPLTAGTCWPPGGVSLRWRQVVAADYCSLWAQRRVCAKTTSRAAALLGIGLC